MKAIVGYLIISLIGISYLTGCVAKEPPVKEESVPGIEIEKSPETDEDRAALEEARKRVEETVYLIQEASELTPRWIEAMQVHATTLSLDGSTLGMEPEDFQMEIMNGYYSALTERPELKYAYGIECVSQEDPLVVSYEIHYMPYKIGKISEEIVPEGTYKIRELQDLITTANASIGREVIPIAILNENLEVEDMQRALMQAGYGYILYSLNNDGTEIRAYPVEGRTMDTCVASIEEILQAADEVIQEIIKPNMSSEEKLEAIYQYVAKNTVYDQRYYTDFENLPYESRTAYGVFYDQLAICGGFSWAVNILANQAGIPCYNVSGVAFGEDHLWNVAKYNGAFYYFDATNDRGLEEGYGFFAIAEKDLESTHSWENAFINPLLGQ